MRVLEIGTGSGYSGALIGRAVDGMSGWPDAAPFDRVVGWTTPNLVPRTWAQ